MSQTAYAAVKQRRVDSEQSSAKKYRSFALKFPSLIHTSGLCQAIAVAQADKSAGSDVLDDVVMTIRSITGDSIGVKSGDENSLPSRARSAGAVEYMRLTRLTMDAASLVKRYVEVVSPDKSPTADGENA